MPYFSCDTIHYTVSIIYLQVLAAAGVEPTDNEGHALPGDSQAGPQGPGGQVSTTTATTGRAGHATTLPRQRDHVFRPQNC